MSDCLTLSACAKLNLTLDILSRRADGYHDLSMVMQSISLCDTVTVALTDEEGIVCHCGTLPGDDSNLAVRAAKAFFAQTCLPMRGLRIDIDKRIPMQAGMAGGSADAAAVLRALRSLLLPSLPRERLEGIGALVGSDVPFCVRGGTVLVEGRGERLHNLRAAPRFFTVVCKPDFSLSTPLLFRRADGVSLHKRPDTLGMLAAIGAGDADAVAQRVCNVFEEVLDEPEREVFTIRERLCALGAQAASMTGSGPTVFGLFAKRGEAERACEVLRGSYRQTWYAEFVGGED